MNKDRNYNILLEDKYMFSKVFADYIKKAESIGFTEHLTPAGECKYDQGRYNMFCGGIPGAFADDEDPFESYLILQLKAFIWDFAKYCYNKGIIGKNEELYTVSTFENEQYVSIVSGKEDDTLKYILERI